MLKIKVGADPELFLETSDGKAVSAHDVLPGTKLEPCPVKFGAIQVDGVAAEFNIDPADNPSQFVRNIQVVMDQMKDASKGLSFSIKPFQVFEKGYFDSLPDVVKELGCNPDFNAWTGTVNPSPDGQSSTMRTASGHLHVGWCEGVNPHSKIHFQDCCTFVKQLDYYVGLFSLMWDPDNTRRQMYGKAGAFRPKPYGCEYRVLSNVWLRSPKIQEWLFTAINQAVYDLINKPKNMVDLYGDYAQTVINNNEVDWWKTSKGREIADRTGLPYPDITEIFSKPKVKSFNKTEFDSEFLRKYVAASFSPPSLATSATTISTLTDSWS